MIKHFFGLSEDKQAVALLFANGSGRTLQSIMEGVTPVLANLFLLAQIVVAIGTAIWFFRRSRGVQLDNEAKEKKRKRKLKMKNLLLLLLLGGLLTGCAGFPLKGGKAGFTSPEISGSINQPQNPKDESVQTYEKYEDKGGKTVLTTRVINKIGAAQKDPFRETAAKLSALKGVVWVGILLFVFGAASAVYPPLKLIVGSLTTSAVCAASGIALIILPSLIVGHEVLILCIGGGVALVWFVAHRHGHIHGQLKSLQN